MNEAEAIGLVERFVACINAGDVAGIAALMTPGHRFIDATGAFYTGRETMMGGWQQYLSSFPDYRIELDHITASGNSVAAFGWASASFQGNPHRHWRTPAAWRALIAGPAIEEWRVYCDVEPMLQSMGVRRFESPGG